MAGLVVHEVGAGGPDGLLHPLAQAVVGVAGAGGAADVGQAVAGDGEWSSRCRPGSGGCRWRSVMPVMRKALS
jgi:hypothetical protein